MTHTVDQLDLHLHGAGLSDQDLRTADRFTRAVLERAFDLIEPRLGGRFLCLRSLPFRLRLDTHDFADARAISDTAADLAAVLDRLLDTPPARAGADAGPVAIFDSAEHRAAAALECLAGRAPAWFAPEYRTVDELLEWAASEAPRVLCALMRRGTLPDVLAAAEPATLLRLRLALTPPATDPDPADYAAPTEAPPPADSRVTAPDSPIDLAAHHPDLHVIRSAVAQAISAAIAPTHELPPITNQPGTAEPPAPSTPVEHNESAATPRPLAPTPPPAQPARGEPRALPTPTPTSAAGLFYLLNPALELDAGEILWRSGLDERMVFTDAARLIAPHAPRDDPAFAQFGGTTHGHVDERHAEQAARELLASLAAAVTRRRFQAHPIRITRAILHARPVILLSLDGLAPVLAVLAAHSSTEPASDIPALWPFGVVPDTESTECADRPRSGTSAATDVDRASAGPVPDGRISEGLPSEDASSAAHPSSEEYLAFEEYLASGSADDLPRRLIAATTAGTLCAMACLRLAHYRERDPLALLARAAATAGELIGTPDSLVVRIPADGVLLPIRRAGLDRDPGWIPWQQREVRFEFPEQPTSDATVARLPAPGGCL